MALYDDLTLVELDAKIVELRTKIETVASGGGVSVIAGEGRRKEFTKSNLDALRALLQDALNAKEKLGNNGRLRGRAIGVRFI
jgi:hypothetical protein